MKKILMSTLFLVFVGAASMAQQKPADAKQKVEPVKQLELPKNKKATKTVKVEAKTAEQKKLEQVAKAEAAKNKKPVQAEKQSEVEN